MRWFVFIFFGCGGLAILIFGFVLCGKRADLYLHGAHTQGKIISAEQATGSKADPDQPSPRTNTPFIQFDTKTGDRVWFQASVGSGSSNPSPGEEVGANIEVIYDPRNPHNAQAATFSQFWLGAVVATVVGLIMTLMGFGIFYSMGKMDKEMGKFAIDMQRETLLMDPKAMRLKGKVEEVRVPPNGKGCILVCSAKLFDGSTRTFESQMFPRTIQSDIRGKEVEIIIDPFDRERYLVHAAPLVFAASK